MNSKQTIVVAMLGIPEQERNILKNILKLSSHRSQAYAVAAADEPSELLLVDADDPQAMAAWQALRDGADQPPPGQAGFRMSIPTVLVTKKKQLDDTAYYIRRPFVAPRVLAVLDEAVSQGRKQGQERVIGEEPATSPAAKPRRPYRALIIDGNKAVRQQIELELRLFGMQVDTAEAGEEALDLLDGQSYDMVFSEVALPGIDGYQVCKSIKKNKPRGQTTIVIFLTAKSSPFDRVRGALAGCDTYLIKPVKQALFQKTVQKYLK